LGESREILERLHDKRAYMVAGAMAVAESAHGDWPTTAKHAQEVLDHADANTDPKHVALMKWLLGQALDQTHGDKQRAKTLVQEAPGFYVQAGASEKDLVKTIDGWLAKH